MYLLSVLAQDEDSQREGCVGITLNMSPFRPVDPADTFRLTNLMSSLARIRYVGYHFCIDGLQQESMISSFGTVLSSAHQFSLVRFRVHSGRLLLYRH